MLLHGAVHAGFLERAVGDPLQPTLPPPHIKQICEGILERGEMALECISNVAPYSSDNGFGVGSDGWYAANNINNILEKAVGHPSLYFLKYKHSNNSITGLELSLDKNANTPKNTLQKAIALLPSATDITVPMKKLPNPIPNQWKKKLNSLSAYNLEHINGGAFKGTSTTDRHYISSLNLPSVESIGNQAFNYDLGLRFITLSNTLKFVGNESFKNTYIPITNIPNFTHFLSGQAFYCYYGSSFYLRSLSIADSLRFNSNAFERNCPETINITCYGRTNNIKGILSKINDNTIKKTYLKNLNIKFSDSIKNVINVNYIKNIITMIKTIPPLDKIKERCLLDFSNTKITESEIQSLGSESIDSNIPWVLSLPHITTVNTNFSNLFKKLKGVILSNAEIIEAGAFADCKDTVKTLGFIDTTTVAPDSLALLEPTTLEITVTHPENLAAFLSDLNNAGLIFSNISRFTIKFPDSAAQNASIGHRVANLLAALPPPKSPRIPGF
jgi:hypothetical protein